MGWLSRNKRPQAAEPAASEPAVPEPAISEPAVFEPPAPQPAASEPAVPEPAVPDLAVFEPPASQPRASGPVPSEEAPRPASPMGEYGPLVTVTRFESAPEELEWQLPVTGELYRVMPGSDRPDYSLMVLERPLHFYPTAGFDLGRAAAEQRVEDRKGRPMVRVNALLLCARYVGQQLHAGMEDLAVNVAYVVDTSLARDAAVDFAKIEYAAIGYLSEGHVERPAAAGSSEAAEVAGPGEGAVPEPEALPEALPEPLVEPPADGVVPEGLPPMVVVDEVVPEVARLLKEGIEQQRGSRIERLTAVLTLDEHHRVSGLSGNADGQSPVPTPETFERLNEALAPLADLPRRDAIAGLTIRLDGDRLTSEVDYGRA